MSFDKEIRNMLGKTVVSCRRKLTEDIIGQLRSVYGLHPDGTQLPLDQLAHLTRDQLSTARVLRELLEHYAAVAAGSERERKYAAYERVVLEISFTVLNRLAALRLCEERGLVIECVRKGTASDGFRLFERVSGGALGTRYDTYLVFLGCVFDEAALDLGVLFDRYIPQSTVFPTERCLEDVLSELNKPELTELWKEDETIGWMYQYFNPQEERRAMREASQAPRNSRELAVRNQFFTPRYVVEFLTDNTLGRTWYEMQQGKTALVDECRYLVRRPDEVFFIAADSPGVEKAQKWLSGADLEEPDLWELAHTVNGYLRAGSPGEGAQEWLSERLHRLTSAETAASLTTQELLDMLFLICRWERFIDGVIKEHEHQINCILEELRLRVNKVKAEDLSQEELLKLPVFVPYRAKKDPRDIKILDPACGSGHFLLYAFDLLERIYREAWEDPDSLASEATGQTLREDYETLDELLRAVPELIIRWNLYGIDIDHRAVQIAALALWLRAQKSWQRMGLKAPERPRIVKSNIVTAEPMPGDKEMLREFTADLQPKVLGQIVETVFEKMKLAGEAGSLLKIEEEISEAIAEAKKQWLEGPKQEQLQLFPDAPKPRQEVIRYDVTDVSDEAFWEQAEERILAALKEYAEGRENGNSIKRRLFAEDAVRGFAFVNVYQQKYDVILMNPPFGSNSLVSNSYIMDSYPFAKYNVACCFIDRSIVLADKGEIGVIIDVATSIRSSYEDYRVKVLYEKNALTSYCLLGWNVLDDANVEVCCYTFSRNNPKSKLDNIIWCIDGTEQKDKSTLLLNCIDKPKLSLGKKTFLASQNEFMSFPNGVPAFYVPKSLRTLFKNYPSMDPTSCSVCTGLSSGDNSRFYKLAWEIQPHFLLTGWFYLSNGGDYSPYYRKFIDVIDWRRNGQLIKLKKGAFIRNENKYFTSGLTYGKRGRYLSVQFHPSKRIFTNEGQCIFPNTRKHSIPLCAFLNSSLAQALINTYCGQHKENGYVKLLPIAERLITDKSISSKLTSLCNLICESYRSMISFSLEHAHTRGCTLLCIEDFRVLTLNESYEKYKTMIKKIANPISKMEIEIEQIINKTYEVDTESLKFIEENIRDKPKPYQILQTQTIPEKKDFIEENMNYFVGAILGRWDLRYALNSKLNSELPDVFEPLPVCPPGMLISPNGLPAKPGHIVSEEWLRARPDAGTLPPEGSVKNPTIPDEEYPIRISWDGILVDDPGFNGGQPHRDDIVRRVREVLELLWGDRAQAIEEEACEILGVSDLREYFRKPSGFFQDHLKRYSKSRRKAPIYWPLSTASGSYTVWLYYHRLNDQTLYAAVNKYIDPKIAEVERAMGRLESELAEGAGRGAASLRDRLNEGRALLGELQELREELLRVAGLPYKPNLNDGVIITAAPLHRLFRLSSWAKDTKSCWEKLERGDYDWAHLAYTLWPERVKEVCRRDRSIAIAHGLEDLCEIKPSVAKRKGGRRRTKEEGARWSLQHFCIKNWSTCWRNTV